MKRKNNKTKIFSRLVQDVRLKSELEIKKYIRLLKIQSDKDIKKYTGALSEEFQSRIKAIGELVVSLAEKLDLVASDVQQIKTTLDSKANYTYVAGIDRRVSALESKKK